MRLSWQFKLGCDSGIEKGTKEVAQTVLATN